MMTSKPKVICLVGPTASGKSSVVKHLLSNYPAQFSKPDKYTTRPRRESERHVSDYRHVDGHVMTSLRHTGKLICEAEHCGNWYGTDPDSISRAMNAGQIPIVIVEPSGAGSLNREVEKLGGQTVVVMLDVPLPDFVDRMIDRWCGGENAETVMTRVSHFMQVERLWVKSIESDILIENNSNTQISGIGKFLSTLARSGFEKVA